MTKDIARKALEFLKRVQLMGSEVPDYIEVWQEIAKVVDAPPENKEV